MTKKKITEAAERPPVVAARPIQETVLIDSLQPGANRELDEAHVENLRESIAQRGLLVPIIVNRDNVILGGGHRYEACKRAGLREVNIVRYSGPEDDERLIQIIENSLRKDLTFKQRLDAAKWVEENCVNPRGRPSTSITNSNREVKNVQNFGHFLGGRVDDAVVALGVYTNPEQYRQAKCMAQTAIPDVIDALDKGLISHHRAYQISKVKEVRQPSLLARVLAKRAEESAETPAQHRMPAAVKKRLKSHAPDCSYPVDWEDKFNIVRIVPDWFGDSVAKICQMFPVGKFVSDLGVVCLQVTMRNLHLAYEALEMWSLHPKAAAVVAHDRGNVNGIQLDYSKEDPIYVIIANIDRDEPLACRREDYLNPFYISDEPEQEAVDIVTRLLGNSEGGNKMLDMSMAEGECRNGWVNWKDEFFKKKKK